MLGVCFWYLDRAWAMALTLAGLTAETPAESCKAISDLYKDEAKAGEEHFPLKFARCFQMFIRKLLPDGTIGPWEGPPIVTPIFPREPCQIVPQAPREGLRCELASPTSECGIPKMSES